LTYSLAFAVAAIVGMIVTEWGSPNPHRYRLLYIAAVAGGVIGARLLYAAQYGFSFRSGGMSLLGSSIGAMVTLLLIQYPGWRRSGYWPEPDFPDAVAPALALGVGVVRIGCFVNGCCFGSVCNLPWAVTYDPGSPAFQRQLAEGLISAGSSVSLPVHPTQLYEAVTAFLAFGVLLYLRRNRTRWFLRNELILGLAAFYGIFRFLIEFLRDDGGGRQAGLITFSQGFSVLIFAMAVFVILLQRKVLKSSLFVVV
jgi:phosphatidylglycerol:prolipoprotein diacylglycerol transferase